MPSAKRGAGDAASRSHPAHKRSRNASPPPFRSAASDEDAEQQQQQQQRMSSELLQTREGALEVLGMDAAEAAQALPALRAPGMGDDDDDDNDGGGGGGGRRAAADEAATGEGGEKEAYRERARRRWAARAPLPTWLAQPERIDVSQLQHAGPAEAGLSPAVCRAFEAAGFRALFAVQAAVVPRVVRALRSAQHPGDLCVSAPTGSGKTLAYVLPALDVLWTRVVRRLRVVVVVPTRQLAMQVHGVFQTLLPLLNAEKGSGAPRVPLTAAIASGGATLAKEQAQVAPTPDGVSPVDILVCTPGRLVEHLQHTPHFNLQHVRLLIIDEADRLLLQAFQGWLDILHLALYPRLEDSAKAADRTRAGDRREDAPLKDQARKFSAAAAAAASFAGGLPVVAGRRHGDMLQRLLAEADAASADEPAVAAAASADAPRASLLARAAARAELAASAARLDPALTTAARHRHPGAHVQKLLFSATLSRDPERLLGLRLAYPTLLVATQSALPVPGTSGSDKSLAAAATATATAGEVMVIPPQMDEQFIECGPQEKPIVLLYCLLTLQMDRTLVFAGDLDTTHRLATLLQLYGGMEVAEVSSDTRSGSNRRTMRQVLRRFEAGELNVLVCSDSMARGVDLENVENVISYDVPHTPSSYIHR